MTKAQTILRDLRNRQSKERGKMAELGAAESLTDETRAELDAIEAGTPDLERQLRAATVAVETEESEQRAAGAAGDTPAGDAEDRERAELRAKVRLGAYVSAAIEQRSAAGAEAEYNAAVGMAGNRFPLELLAPAEHRAARTEDRAATGVDIATTPRTWLDRLFSGTAAEGVGVTMESVSGRGVQSPRDHGGRDGGAARQIAGRGRCRLDPRRNRVEAQAERRAAAVQY